MSKMKVEELLTKDQIRKRTVKDMKALGIYKEQYDRLIEMYAEMCEQYAILNEEFKASNYSCEVETPQGGSKKAPIVATLEALRKDILAFSDRLCLNPKARETVTVEKESKSKLARALRSIK